ncbi:MAG: hypothetical protein QOC80_3056 [Frankiaceae bacterium]|nr:hypothetical protein [Frankiaceae bacterium]
MRSFTSQYDYATQPAELVRLWCDPEFLAAVGHRFGGVGEPEITRAGTEMHVVTRRQLPLDKIPSFVRRFIADGTLQQTDVWPAEPGDGTPVTGAWTVEGSMPAKMSGTQTVEPTATGCRIEVKGTVDVSAPLVAGKIEDLISREITKLIGVQQAFAAQWLAGERPAA